MVDFREIKRALKTKGIEVKKIRATLNGSQAYRVRGSEYNPAALWTAQDIRDAYQRGEFA